MFRLWWIAGLLGFGAGVASAEVYPSLRVGVESDYVFRGQQRAEASAQASFELASDSAYGFVWTNQPLEESAGEEYNFFGGYLIEANPLLTLDLLGGVYYYPDEDSRRRGEEATYELGVGLFGELPVAKTTFYPRLYLFYDLELEDVTVEASIAHRSGLSERASLDLALDAGFVSLGQAAVSPKGESSDRYGYAQATADLVLRISDYVSASAGVRASAVTDAETHNEGDEMEFWAGASIQARF
ncbi:MAG: TorF family putative porin [Verrucomicrobiota bacterium]